MYNLIVILGPTASGKTKLAARLAYEMGTEIISADSRQVYKGMDIGTGKDLSEYTFHGKSIPFHLINIKEAGDSYHVADFQEDFKKAFQEIRKKGKTPILCGGTGMYIDAVLKNYAFTSVPINEALRKELETVDDKDLMPLFQSVPSVYSHLADTSTRKRMIRAIEIGKYLQTNPLKIQARDQIHPLIFGLNPSLEDRRTGITARLRFRLEHGLIEEVQELLSKGISSDKLVFYGLEYKFVTEYLTGQLPYSEMVEKLTIAIHQYAKRQMTYFRKMQRDGLTIHWLNPEKELLPQVRNLVHQT